MPMARSCSPEIALPFRASGARPAAAVSPLSGFAAYSGGPLAFRLHARLDQVRVRYPEGVSTVADANLNFTGTTDRSMLAGTITILRTGFNPQSDFSSIMLRNRPNRCARPRRSPGFWAA